MKIPKECRWRPTGRNLGAGGAGEVVEVTDSSGKISGTAALKALRSGRPAAAYTRFRNEMAALRQLDHPNIVKILDFSEDESFPYYVMPLLDKSRSLRQCITRNANPFTRNARRAIRMVEQLLEALACCEKAGITHRDLSTANVLVLGSYDIMLIDFGLCHLDSGERLTLTEEGLGTPNYHAPEGESGNPGSVSLKSDFYSIGKVLWAAVANQEAFAREKAVFGAKSFQSMFPNEPLLWHLDLLFEKTIRWDPTNRWQDTTAALADCRLVRSLVTSNALTVLELETVCPHCRIGRLDTDRNDWHLFANPMPPNKRGLACSVCGYCFVRDWKVFKTYFDNRERLE